VKSLLCLCLLIALLWQETAFAIKIAAPRTILQTPAATENLNYNFGAVRVNRREYVDLRISNTGAEAMTFDQMMIYGSAFRANSDCPGILAIGKSCIVTVRFSPSYAKPYWGTLLVNFTNGNSIQLNLRGRGIEY
jgi:hypothetical protein